MFFNTPFFTFSYFTYFYFFFLYLYLCKNFYLHFWLNNDRSSNEASRAVALRFYFTLLSKTFTCKHLLFPTKKGVLYMFSNRKGISVACNLLRYLSKKRIFRASLFPGSLFVFVFSTTMETLGTRLIFRVLVFVFI